MPVGKGVEGVVDELAQRLRILQLLHLLHPLVVLHAFGLPCRDRLVLHAIELLAEDQLGVLEDRLDQREHVERVLGRLGIEQRQRLEQVERQRLVHREVVLQVEVHPQLRPIRCLRDELDDLARHERAEQLPGIACCAPSSPTSVSWLSRISRCIARQPSSRRLSTFSSMPCVTWKRDTSCSGCAPISRVKVCRSQLTKLWSGCLRSVIFLPSRADFSLSRMFSMTCSGAWAQT